jgi:hypothetical protein
MVILDLSLQILRIKMWVELRLSFRSVCFTLLSGDVASWMDSLKVDLADSVPLMKMSTLFMLASTTFFFL